MPIAGSNNIHDRQYIDNGNENDDNDNYNNDSTKQRLQQ